MCDSAKMLVYTCDSGMWAVVLIINGLAAVLAFATVSELFRKKQAAWSRKLFRGHDPRKVYLLIWTVAPPLWFALEYFVLWPRNGTRTDFEFFKYGQDIASKAWLTMTALTTADLFRRQPGEERSPAA